MGGGVSVEEKRSLMDSVVKGDGFRVQTLIRRMKRSAGGVVNSFKDASGNSLLVLAVQSGDESTVDALLSAKADPSRPSGQSKSPPLIYVARVEKELAALGIARGLLDAKASVNCQNMFQQTPLYMCASRHGRGLVQYLLDRGARVQHWNDTFNRSLLMEFFMGGMDIGNIALLIDKGAELGDKERDTLLHVAAHAGNHQLLELILQRTGAGKPHIEARDAYGQTVLHIAAGAGSGSAASMELLLRASADLETVNAKGESALQTAIEVGQVEVACLLVARKADPNHSSPSNTSPLLAACRHASRPFQLVQTLLSARGDPSRQENVSLSTPLHAMAEREDGDEEDCLETMSALLRYGAKPSVRDATGRLPLHLAYQAAGRLGLGPEGGECVALLVGAAGLADVHTKDYGGREPRDCYQPPDHYLFGADAEQYALAAAVEGGWEAHGERDTAAEGGGGWGKGKEKGAPQPQPQPQTSHHSAPAHAPAAHRPAGHATEAEAAIVGYLSTIRQRAEHTRHPPPADDHPMSSARPAGAGPGGGPGAYPPQHPMAPQPPPTLDPCMLSTLARPRRHTPANSVAKYASHGGGKGGAK